MCWGSRTEVGDARPLLADLVGDPKDGSNDAKGGGNNVIVEDLGGDCGGGSASGWPPRQTLRA